MCGHHLVVALDDQRSPLGTPRNGDREIELGIVQTLIRRRQAQTLAHEWIAAFIVQLDRIRACLSVGWRRGGGTGKSWLKAADLSIAGDGKGGRQKVLTSRRGIPSEASRALKCVQQPKVYVRRHPRVRTVAHEVFRYGRIEDDGVDDVESELANAGARIRVVDGIVRIGIPSTATWSVVREAAVVPDLLSHGRAV